MSHAQSDYWNYPPHMLRRTFITAMRQGKRFTCGICQETIDSKCQLTIDHIIPKSKGGSNEYENLQPAHQRCNSRKGDVEPLIEFAVYRPSERPHSLQNITA